MRKISAVLFLTVLIISFFAAARAEGIGPYSDMTAYRTGKYTVGKDFDAGEYILFCLPYLPGFFSVSADAAGQEVISEGTFDNNTILKVEDGDHLILTDCIAVSSEDYYSAHRISLTQYGGMLKVGVDVAPGTYRLTGQADKTSVYRIYSDSRTRQVVKEREFHHYSKVRLEENQYLELIDCSFNAPSAKPTATPEPSPTPAAENNETTAPVDTTETSEPADGLSAVSTEATNAPSSSETQAPTPTPVPKVTRKVRIEQNRSPVIRSLPSTKGEKIGVAEAGKEYVLLDMDEKWFKIRLDDGTEGWITRGMAEIVE